MNKRKCTTDPTRAFKLLAGIACVVLLAACASGAQPATQQAQTPVTLALQWVTQAQFAGYYVALEKGWYAEEGIDLDIRPGGPDTSPLNSVSLGTAQFGTSLLADVIVNNQDLNQLVSIAQIQQRNGLLLIAKKDSGISQPRDFAGKRVGVWLGSWEAQFNALIAREGVKSDQFTLVAQSFSMDDFVNGKLDVASAMIYNEYYTVLEKGIQPEELNIIDYADYGLGFPGDVLFTTKKLAKQNPQICVGMVRASLRGWQYAVEHQEEAVDIVLKYDESGLQTREHQAAMMREIAKLVQVEDRPIGYTDRADIQRIIDTLYSYEILKSPFDPKDIFTNDFWEKSRN
jgi:NitT/TauT family transport system substrate-binding protein